MGGAICGTGELPANPVVSATDYAPSLRRFLLSNPSIYFTGQGIENVTLSHPTFTSFRCLFDFSDSESVVQALLKQGSLEVLALVAYYTLENGYELAHIQGVPLLRQTLGHETQWDFFVLKMLVGLQFPIETGELRERVRAYAGDVIRALERKHSERPFLFFEATEVGCFALALALDPSQLSFHHSLLQLLLNAFCSVQSAQDRSAVVCLLQVLIAKQLHHPYLNQILQILQQAGDEQLLNSLTVQKSDSTTEDDSLLIDCYIGVDVENLGNQAISLLRRHELRVRSSVISSISQRPRLLAQFVGEFCPDERLSEVAMDICMQQYMRLVRKAASREGILFLKTLLDSLDSSTYPLFPSIAHTFFQEMLSLSIVSAAFTQRYLDFCLRRVLREKPENWDDISAFYSQCIGKPHIETYRDAAFELTRKLIEASRDTLRLPTRLIYLIALFLHTYPSFLAAIQEMLPSYPESNSLASALSTPLPKAQFPSYFTDLVADLDSRFEEILGSKQAFAEYMERLTAALGPIQLEALPADYFNKPIDDCTRLFVHKLETHLKSLCELSDTAALREEVKLVRKLVSSDITKLCLNCESHKQLLVLSIIGQALYEAFEGTMEQWKPLTQTTLETVFQDILQAYVSRCSQPSPKTSSVIETVTKSKCLRSAMVSLHLDTYCLENFASRVYVTNVVKNAYAVTTFGGLVFLSERLEQLDLEYSTLLYITVAHEAVHCSMRVHCGFYDALHRTEEREIVIGCPGDSRTHSKELHSKKCGDQIEEQLFGCKVTMLTKPQCKYLTREANWKSRDLNSFKLVLHRFSKEATPEEVKYMPRKAETRLMALREKCRYRGS